MPAESRKQQRWAYAKLEPGNNDTGMTKAQLEDFAKNLKKNVKGKK